MNCNIIGMIAMAKTTRIVWPSEFLAEWTGEPIKVCYAAVERAKKRGYIDCGVSLRSGWLTDKGKELIMVECSGEKEPSIELCGLMGVCEICGAPATTISQDCKEVPGYGGTLTGFEPCGDTHKRCSEHRRIPETTRLIFA